MLFEKRWHSFRKKFYRRTALLTFFCYASILNAVTEDEIIGNGRQYRFLGRGPGQHLSKPFTPYVEVLSPSEVKVWWLPVMTHGGAFNGRYELYIGDEMEYVGHDLEYIAKRLKPATEYEFRIRACGVELGTCSDFSFPKYAKTELQPRFGGTTMSAMTSTYLGKRRIFLVLSTAIFGPIAVIAFMISVFLFFRYMFYHLRHSPCLNVDLYDPEVPYTPLKRPVTEPKANINQWDELDSVTSGVNCQIGSAPPPYDDTESNETTPARKKCEELQTESFDVKVSDNSSAEGGNHNEDGCLPTCAYQEANRCSDESSCQCSSGSSDDERSDDTGRQKHTTNKEVKDDNTSSENDHVDVLLRKTSRQRTRSLRKQARDKKGRTRSISEGDRKPCSGRLLQSDDPNEENHTESVTNTNREKIVVVVDNSNIFIGARETACAETPGLKQRHVKMRLHTLAKVLEKRRPVSLAYAGGSSPPGNPHVWDVYRRLGYVVDLEDRRGKDEQRVDELLHLSIYKALIEMPPQTLVLATGDGSKGKGSGETSFPKCAEAALDQGWKVEVHSWRHCLSAEWLKIAAKHRSKLKINYLDEHLHDITFIEYKPRRQTAVSHDAGSSPQSETPTKSNEYSGNSQVNTVRFRA